MEASIDYLAPRGHVLEIGFGCAYSASQILKHPIKSYTIIECDPVVIKKIKKWRENKAVPIDIVEGTWQEMLPRLGKFDEIYFDDFPLNINTNSSQLEIAVSKQRIKIFIDVCIQNHTNIGSRFSFYMNGNEDVILSSDAEPFINKVYKTIDISIPEICNYRDLKEQRCTIPLFTKIKDYDFNVAQIYAMSTIMNGLSVLEKYNMEECQNDI